MKDLNGSKSSVKCGRPDLTPYNSKRFYSMAGLIPSYREEETGGEQRNILPKATE